jgi:hypothetical protein
MTLPSTNGSCPSRRPARDGPDSRQRGLKPLHRNRQPPAGGSTALSDDLRTFAGTRSAPTPTSLPLAAQSDHAADESARDRSGREAEVIRVRSASPSRDGLRTTVACQQSPTGSERHAGGRLEGYGSRYRFAWRLSHKPPTDPVRRSVMGRPMLRTAADVPQVGDEPRQSDESRYVSHQLGSKAFRTPLCNSLHGMEQ